MEVAMKIYVSRNTETLIYAASELAKYLHMMDESITAEIAVGVVGNKGYGIALGLLDELSLPTDGVVDAVLDDVTDIDVKALSGHIAGSNERSVLTGVYNFLKSAGCLWVRPGDDGEYIPKKSMKEHSFVWRKKADFCLTNSAKRFILRGTEENLCIVISFCWWTILMFAATFTGKSLDSENLNRTVIFRWFSD
jgi:hypothetical protein